MPTLLALCISIAALALVPLRCAAGEAAAGLPAFEEQAENQRAVDGWLAMQRKEVVLREMGLLRTPPLPKPNSLISPVRLPAGALDAR
jgi:hypothetical protein